MATTITRLEGGTVISAERLFNGFRFTPQSIAELEARALERSGESARAYFDEVKQRTKDWSAEDYQQAEQEAAEIERRLLALLKSGAPVDDPAVFAVLEDDVAGQRRIWTFDADMYAALGRAFVEFPELRAHLDAQDPRLAAYLRDAMVAYARARLV